MTDLKKLIQDGYKQVSSKYRMLARLPPGKTGLQALAEVDPRLAHQFLENAERSARMMFLRCHSKDTVELSPEKFVEFKKLGGEAP